MTHSCRLFEYKCCCSGFNPVHSTHVSVVRHRPLPAIVVIAPVRVSCNAGFSCVRLCYFQHVHFGSGTFNRACVWRPGLRSGALLGGRGPRLLPPRRTRPLQKLQRQTSPRPHLQDDNRTLNSGGRTLDSGGRTLDAGDRSHCSGTWTPVGGRLPAETELRTAGTEHDSDLAWLMSARRRQTRQ